MVLRDLKQIPRVKNKLSNTLNAEVITPTKITVNELVNGLY